MRIITGDAQWNHEFAETDAQMLDYADIPGVSLFSLDTQGWSRDQFRPAPVPAPMMV